jgi:hypothetical protein
MGLDGGTRSGDSVRAHWDSDRVWRWGVMRVWRNVKLYITTNETLGNAYLILELFGFEACRGYDVKIL